MFDLKSVIRKNIASLKPYSSARQEFSENASIWLDANESPFETNVNRYPDPYQKALKKEISALKGLDVKQIFIGNGSDEAIDLLFRAFCEPLHDKSYLFSPTYGMYEVLANINAIETVKIQTNERFQLPSVEEICEVIDSKGLLFICTPNNPTGNVYALDLIKKIASKFSGLVVVDEAYIDFSNASTAINLLQEVPNLVVLQTLSKAYGLAGLRLGMAFASEEIIEILNKIKPPYNVNSLSQVEGVKVLKNKGKVFDNIVQIKQERSLLIESLSTIPSVIKIYPSEANFLLVEFKDSNKVLSILRSKGIIIRNRTAEIKNCLRITVGTGEQNKVLINTIRNI